MKRSSSPRAFTLIEMLVVMVIIAILMGLVLSINGLVQKKSGLARAETEIQALSTACDNYKIDNGTVPRSIKTDTLDSTKDGDPTKVVYQDASKTLYTALSGDTNADGNFDTGEGKNYAPDFFKPNRLGGTKVDGKATAVTYIMDPFGYSYGYSTIYQADLDKTPPSTSPRGRNPTFDLWCTAGKTTSPTANGGSSDVTNVWVKNW